jgi:hypothetical protein
MIKTLLHTDHKKTSARVWIIGGLTVISFLSIIFLLVYTQYIRSFDSFLINMSGRERMLSQKISKETLLYRTDRSIIHSIDTSVDLFENTLLAIRHGGDVFTNLQLTEKRFVPPPTDPVLIANIDSTIELWRNFQKSVYSYLNSTAQENLEQVMILNPMLLEKLDSLTALLQENAEWRNGMDIFFISFFIVLFIAMLLVFLRNRILELRKATHIIESLETILPICANCKKIKEKSSDNIEEETWISIEEYISRKDATKFTHGICPECAHKLYPDLV